MRLCFHTVVGVGPCNRYLSTARVTLQARLSVNEDGHVLCAGRVEAD